MKLPQFHATLQGRRGTQPYVTSGAAPVKRLLVPLSAVGALFIFLGLAVQGPFSAASSTETITVKAADCQTPDTTFVLGDTVCATIAGAPLEVNGFRQRRVQWLAPDGAVANLTDVTIDPQNDSYTVPTSGTFSQVGTWQVRLINNRSTPIVIATFVVKDPANLQTDLAVNKSGPALVNAGSNVIYTVVVRNYGPDDAQSVQLVDAVPAGTSFVTETQNSGPSFTCDTTSTQTTCTITTLAAGAEASFTLIYNVSSTLADDSTITNTATISSTTAELHAADNTAMTVTSIRGTSVACSVNCPSDVSVTGDGCGSVATYPDPTTTGDCGTPFCTPPSGSVFPNGSTIVTCIGDRGDPCTFTVTVTGNDTTPPTLVACPANITAAENPAGSGFGRVDFDPPTASDNCSGATVQCTPFSGNQFPVGTTTVTCTATDASGNTATCSFTVTVTGEGGGCELSCEDLSVVASAAQCNAVVTYPDPATTGNCGTITCSPVSGSTFPVGSSQVTCTSGSGSGSCSFTVTVSETTLPTITTCAANRQIPADASCQATIPDLTSEVVASDNCGTVTKSQAPPAGTVVGVGDTPVTIVVEDASGNAATCTAIVAVRETTTPSVTCPPGTTTNADPNCQAAVPNVTGGVTASDNCSPPEALVITQSPAAGTLTGVGVTTITVTATDESGNSSTCTTTFTVNDVIPPTITCPANISVTAAIGQTSTVVTFSPIVTDNCSGASAICLPPSGSTFQLGVTTVTCTASDASNNHATCSFAVAVSGTLLATADSFLRDGADNTNEGGNDLLRIQSSGHNRVMARFNTSGISTTGLQSATLILNITENSDNWGTTGRLVDAHRLVADWTEGNGHTVGSQPNFRGTGEGVTWNCAKDANISNQNDDCTSQWDGGTIAAATAASVLHTNNQMGDVSWIVTADVIAGASNGWVIKKQTEGQNGQVKYHSREGAAAAGNSSLGPRLVLVYQP